jgi:L-aspartate oxidase
MSAHAGVLRDAAGLDALAARLATTPVLGHPARTRAEVEATSLHLVAHLVSTAALTRTESRGCHRRSDFPATDPRWESSVALRWSAGALRATVTGRRAAA